MPVAPSNQSFTSIRDLISEIVTWARSAEEAWRMLVETTKSIERTLKRMEEKLCRIDDNLQDLVPIDPRTRWQIFAKKLGCLEEFNDMIKEFDMPITEDLCSMALQLAQDDKKGPS